MPERRLITNLTQAGIPLPLISQYLPDQYHRIRDGLLPADPAALVTDRIRDALRPYARACRLDTNDGATIV